MSAKYHLVSTPQGRRTLVASQTIYVAEGGANCRTLRFCGMESSKSAEQNWTLISLVGRASAVDVGPEYPLISNPTVREPESNWGGSRTSVTSRWHIPLKESSFIPPHHFDLTGFRHARCILILSSAS
ncbi:unnamed protein product [Somion occarium]|uniref:Uncharacterized protein n=1 Tax=Somion occarium TaxID=3059160 RepID=A0ABP1CUH0_9APHY